MKDMLDICNIPGCKHYSGNAPSSLAYRTDGCKTVQDHNGHGAPATSSLALTSCHAAEIAAAGDVTMTAGTLLLTQ